MNKSKLIERVALAQHITKTRAELVVHEVFEALSEALAQGNHVEIRGFGTFEVRHYKAYQGVNPRTAQRVEVASKRVPFFRVGKKLREEVNAHAGQPLAPDGDAPDETDLDPDPDPESDDEGDD